MRYKDDSRRRTREMKIMSVVFWFVFFLFFWYLFLVLDRIQIKVLFFIHVILIM